MNLNFLYFRNVLDGIGTELSSNIARGIITSDSVVKNWDWLLVSKMIEFFRFHCFLRFFFCSIDEAKALLMRNDRRVNCLLACVFRKKGIVSCSKVRYRHRLRKYYFSWLTANSMSTTWRLRQPRCSILPMLKVNHFHVATSEVSFDWAFPIIVAKTFLILWYILANEQDVDVCHKANLMGVSNNYSSMKLLHKP